MRMRRLAVVGLLLAGGLGLGAAAPVQAPGFNPIKTRQAGQALVFGSFIGMREAVKHSLPVKPFAEPATAISRWMEQYPSLFPPGSDTGDKTRALPAIWKDFGRFKQDAANASAAASKLALLAKADDRAGFAAQLKVLGGACGTCHKAFRAK